MSLEELREFLQEQIAQTFLHSDDMIVEQLQASMTELRKMKLDLPPPGAPPLRLRLCRFSLCRLSRPCSVLREA